MAIHIENTDFPNEKLDLTNMPSIARILSKQFTESAKHTDVEVDFLIIDVPLKGLDSLSSDICYQSR